MGDSMSTSFPMDGKRVRFSGDTNVGMKRDHNEDSFFLPVNERLAIVADGMGGHASGEVASRMAVDSIVGYFRETEGEQQLTWPFKVDRGHGQNTNRMTTAIKMANQRIFEEAERKPECRGMGTTVVSTLFLDDVVIVGHVGDSRLYRVREGAIDQITEDHSLLNDYVRMKRMSEAEIAAFPHKNVIVRALGMKPSIEVDIIVENHRLGDLFVICSDGLSGMVSDTEIAGLAVEEGDLDKLCERLIATANGNGGVDNITVVCARLEPL
jgi:protein phosphatase